jgi:glucokinase
MNQENNLPLALGVDLGGTKVALAVVDAEGRVVSRHKKPTEPQRGPERVVEDVIACLDECLDEQARARARILGVGFSGQVDEEAGLVRSAPNLPGWKDVELRRMLEQALDVRAVISNDVHVIALGERAHGAGRGCDDLVVVFVGTGVGAGVVTGGQLLCGARGYAGELGHMPVVVGGRECSCGSRGCLEAYVGGWAIGARAREAVAEDPQAGGRLVELAGGHEEIDAAAVGRAYDDGDALARRLVDETGNYLGAGLGGAVNLFNPERLLLGGGVIDGVPDLVEMGRERLRDHALGVACERLEVRPAELGADAGVVGAALLAHRRLGGS